MLCQVTRVRLNVLGASPERTNLQENRQSAGQVACSKQFLLQRLQLLDGLFQQDPSPAVRLSLDFGDLLLGLFADLLFCCLRLLFEFRNLIAHLFDESASFVGKFVEQTLEESFYFRTRWRRRRRARRHSAKRQAEKVSVH